MLMQRRILSIGIVAIVVSVAFTFSIFATAYATAISWIAPGIQVNGNTEEFEWEPYIVAKRASSTTLASGMIQQDRTGGATTCTVYRTTNTAQSWSAGTFNADPKNGEVGGGDPVLGSFAGGNLVYVCFGATVDPGTGNLVSTRFVIFKSTDNGATWIKQNEITPSDYGMSGSNFQLDKPWIAVDRGVDTAYKDRTYLCWTQFDYTARTTKIFFARVNLGTSPDLTDVKELDSATWPSSNRWNGPYVQGCQIATGPGKSGFSGNEVFVVWEKITGTTSGNIRFNANYVGGSSTQWKYTASSAPNIGSISRYTDLTSCNTNSIIDGCLPGDPASYRATHIPTLVVDKTGNPHVAWTSYGSTQANIRYNSAYNAGTQFKNPTWNSYFQLTSTSDNYDRREPALTLYEDTSTRGTVLLTVLKSFSSTDNRWRQWSYHCHPTADTGTGSCHAAAEWSNIIVNSNDITDNDVRNWVGDYHGVASTTTKMGINTFAWHRFVPIAWISDTISYRTS